jgi:putative hydrolase of the HAD superfamily
MLTDLICDLDSTLYPATSGLAAAMEARMIAYINRLLGVEEAAARALMAETYRTYGLTALALRELYGVNIHEYLGYVHDLAYDDYLQPNPQLDAALAAIPLRKCIFTNAPGHHARAVLARLGVAHHFERIFDLGFSELRPKPALVTYRRVLATLAIPGSQAILIEDTAHNLPPAQSLGMTTIWVGEGPPPPAANFTAPDILAALTIVAELAGGEELPIRELR